MGKKNNVRQSISSKKKKKFKTMILLIDLKGWFQGFLGIFFSQRKINNSDKGVANSATL